MNKARFWAVFMTCLLVFSTFTNDFIVANAEIPDVIEQDAPAPAYSDGIEQDASAPANSLEEGGAESYSFTLDDEGGEAGEGSGEGEDLTDDGLTDDGKNAYEDGEEALEGESEGEGEGEGLTDDCEKVSEDEEEVSYPAKDFGIFYADDVSVTISAPEGAFPEGTTVSVQAISGEQFRSKAEVIADDDEVVVDIFAVDITFTYNGEPIEPKKAVSVSFSRLNLSGDDLTVVHEDEVLSDGENTSSVDVTVPSFSPVYAFTTRSASALSEEGAATAKYTVNVYYQKQNRTYNDNADESKTYDCNVGQKIEYVAAAGADKVEGITYAIDTEKSKLSIEGAAADADGSVNVLNVYYKRTANKVYFSILYPGYAMPADASAQKYVDFYPSRTNRYSWPGVAKDLENSWSVYDASGASVPTYVIEWPEADSINTYLAETYGEGVTMDDVIWYTYKCDQKNYYYNGTGGAVPYTSDWYINGYVNVPCPIYYDQNRPDGQTSATYKDTNTKGIGAKYTILGSEGDKVYSMTQGISGWRFIGWSTDPNAKSPSYHPGDKIDFAKTETFYGVWEEKVPEVLTVYAGSDEKVYDGEELKNSDFTYVCGTEGSADVDLPEGWTIEVKMTDDSVITDAGSTENKIASVTVKNGDEDVTFRIKTIDFDHPGTLKVNPAPLYVTTYSNSGVYTGDPVTAGGRISGVVPRDENEVKLVVTGRQVEVGQSRNTYRIDWNGAKSTNYYIEHSRGWLTVYDSFLPDNPTPDDPTPDNPTPDDPTPDTPTPDNPTPDNPTPYNPTPANPTPYVFTLIPTLIPTPDNPIPDNPTPDEPTPDEPALIPALFTETPAEAVPLAGVLGASRGIEADHSSVLGQRRAAAETGVLGARRDAVTQDANHMAMYLMLMGVATGACGAYVLGRRRKHED
ncbi:hypothetical protein SAMN02910292_03119 [Lachnospiraceae bacterium XBB2008]|nr:hypothetical protein SAMN02910292_03119 [Lachnospiraceae bacterium XBB2008]